MTRMYQLQQGMIDPRDPSVIGWRLWETYSSLSEATKAAKGLTGYWRVLETIEVWRSSGEVSR